jgi:adenylate kinase
MGPPGAGKGTHAAPLSQHLNIPPISTGDLFRENIRNQTPLGVKAKSFIEKGNLVPDELVLDMLFERVAKPDCKNGYILDGFPRTIPQAEALDLRLQAKVIALNFHLADSIIIERITGRIMCRSCGRPYHKKYDIPQKEMLCDECEVPLYQRDDDREEIIRKRLEVYRLQTEPLIEYYAKKKLLCNIDSKGEKSQVFHRVLEALPPLPVLVK